MALGNEYALDYWMNSNRSQAGQVKNLVNRFNTARFHGRISSMLGSLFGRSTHLLDLGAFHSRNEGRSAYVGIHTVRIDQIRGSESRCLDFDQEFNPRSDKSRSRWISVAQAKLNGTVLPPVELVQVGSTYFVRDGHHRISVAHSLGEKYIEAEIILEK